MAYEPLRSTAARLHRSGALNVGADLMHELDYVDDRPEVGGKVAKKLKKAVKKVSAVAKKVATSKLGKILTMAVSLTNPASASTMPSALSAAIVR